MSTTFGSSSPSELMHSAIGNTKSLSTNIGLTSPPAISNPTDGLSNGLASIETSISDQVSSINTSSWFGLSTTQIIIIVVILAFLGVNIFRYMDVILNKLVSILAPFFQTFGVDLASFTKNIIGDTAAGTKVGVDIAAGVADSTINLLSGSDKNHTDTDAGAAEASDEEASDEEASAVGTAPPPRRRNTGSKSNMLDNAINRIKNKTDGPSVAPDNTDSIQQGRTTAKSPAFCYIGTDRGIRSCASVNHKSECASDDMFQTMQQCVYNGGGPVKSDRLNELDSVQPYNKEVVDPTSLMKRIEHDIYDAV